MTKTRLALIAAALVGCSPPAPDPCDGDACAPRGGVPASACGTGFRSDGDGGCDPILPTDPCPAGTMPVLGDTACHPVGVSACAEGFVSDGRGGCNAILPASACTGDTMAIPGDATCRPVATCAAGTYGDAPASPTRLHVDGSYTGMDGDGSATRPFAKVQSAIDAAPTGMPTIVAIAPGTYSEDVTVRKPVQLWGRCASDVRIVGVTVGAAALQIASPNVELHGIGVGGADLGVHVVASASLLVDRAIVRGAAGGGLFSQNATIAVRDSLFDANGAVAVRTSGGTATIERTVLRGTLLLPDGTFGRGVNFDTRVKGVLRRSVVERNHDVNVMVYGASATLESSVVRDSLPASSGSGGQGVLALPDGTSAKTDVTIRGSLFERNLRAAIDVQGSTATIADTVVRDTKCEPASKKMGRGLGATSTTGVQADVTVHHSVFERNHEGGVGAVGSKVTVEDSIVRATLPQDGDKALGFGLAAVADGSTKIPGTLTAVRTLVEDNHQAGINILGGVVDLDAVVVRGTVPSKFNGFGIAVDNDAPTGLIGMLSARQCIFERNTEAGIAVNGGNASLESSLVRDTQPNAAGVLGMGMYVSWIDGVAANANVQSSVFDGNREVGIATFGGTVHLDGAVVSNTAAAADGQFGDGLAVQPYPDDRSPHGTMIVKRSLIARNARAGALAVGGDLTLSDSRFACNAFDLAMEPFAFTGSSQDATLVDGGGNLCGCDTLHECRAASVTLTPIRSK